MEDNPWDGVHKVGRKHVPFMVGEVGLVGKELVEPGFDHEPIADEQWVVFSRYRVDQVPSVAKDKNPCSGEE